MAIHVAWCLSASLVLASMAAAGECRLALILALDVSESVSEHEDWLQRGVALHCAFATRFLARGFD